MRSLVGPFFIFLLSYVWCCIIPVQGHGPGRREDPLAGHSWRRRHQQSLGEASRDAGPAGEATGEAKEQRMIFPALRPWASLFKCGDWWSSICSKLFGIVTFCDQTAFAIETY